MHGNEPTLHVPYYFYLLNDRSGGHQWVTWLLDNRYDDGPVGLAGNDDGGALSAWAVFSMMGIYPIAGTTEYVLGQPTWNSVQVYTERHPLQIHVDPNLNSIQVNGESSDSPTISHDDLSHIVFGNR